MSRRTSHHGLVAEKNVVVRTTQPNRRTVRLTYKEVFEEQKAVVTKKRLGDLKETVAAFGCSIVCGRLALGRGQDTKPIDNIVAILIDQDRVVGVFMRGLGMESRGSRGEETSTWL